MSCIGGGGLRSTCEDLVICRMVPGLHRLVPWVCTPFRN